MDTNCAHVDALPLQREEGLLGTKTVVSKKVTSYFVISGICDHQL